MLLCVCSGICSCCTPSFYNKNFLGTSGSFSLLATVIRTGHLCGAAEITADAELAVR